MEIVENHRLGQFPATINSNFRRLLEFSIPHNEISLRATARQYEVAVAELESNVGYVSGYRMGYCGQSTSRFVGTLDRILQTIEEELMAQEQLFEKKMSENPIYKNWYARTSTLEKDRETLKRVVKTMERASQDSTVMSKSELHQRMENLRHHLFGSSGTLNEWLPWRSKAPLEAWLEHSSGEHARFVGLFNNSLESLMKEVSEMRVENRKNKKVVKETYSLLPTTRINELFFDEMAHINFAYINAKNFPLGNAKQEAMCQRLEDSWLSWAAALDHLQAIKHLCANIASFIDSKTGSGVVSVCGRKRIDCKMEETSLIAKTELLIKPSGLEK
jgi:hypothetical protein